MNKVQSKLTVFFDGIFWVGVLERQVDNKLAVVKHIFGAEPKDIEIYQWILHHYHQLIFSTPVSLETQKQDIKNPKRMQRVVKKQTRRGIGTKSQQALKKQQEENKQVRKRKTREQKEQEKQKIFQVKQKKKLEKHKGR